MGERSRQGWVRGAGRGTIWSRQRWGVEQAEVGSEADRGG